MVSTELHRPEWGSGDPDARSMGARHPFVLLDGVEHYRIDDVDHLEPFLTTVVSGVDLWMFVSSVGSLTAGRVDADHAVFPYLPDDTIHRGAGSVGPVTVLARTVGGQREIWRPFHDEHRPNCRRSLARSTLGDRLVFEEFNASWKLRVRATWAPSPRFGWIRTVDLCDEGSGVSVEILDGLLDVMPPGIDPTLEQGSSNLVNAFKRSELVDQPTRPAIFTLESLITDRAEPGESLTSAVACSWGLTNAVVDLDGRAVRHFLTDEPGPGAELVTGRPGAYLLRSRIDLSAGQQRSWSMAVDTGLDHAGLTARLGSVASPDFADRVAEDVAAGSARLGGLVAQADGVQETADRVADAHHLSNVLFNTMRGGVFPYGHRVPVADLIDFLEVRNRPVAQRQTTWAAGLGPQVDVRELRDRADDTGDPDLVRLVLEYLPLTFSRRHGDPSRPWNQFSIHVAADDGSEILRYEGNWRDIFQNWEALLASFPSYFPHVVSKFVNASTLDGYNPYRISREGLDWEVPDPHDPWANIGYWGDHQIIYLLRLLEAWERFAPAAIDHWLDRDVFVYADVPYRISDRSDMIRDPRATITFLEDRASAVTQREASIGSDGRLVVDGSGDLLRVGLAEKLLVPALSKMSSYVPGGGIWMNTQRPEWNDANNALAGPGVSMVTVFHLHRYLRVLRDHLAPRDQVRLSSPVASWLEELAAVCREHQPPEVDDDASRRAMIDALGAVADAHGRRLLAGARTEKVVVAVENIVAFLNDSLRHLDATIAVSRRPDGLFESYSLLSFADETTAQIERLEPMLEGQVAVLSAGLVTPDETISLIDALYDSDMYRPDLDTFMLYPAKVLRPFVDRNIVGSDLSPEIGSRLPSVFSVDIDGRLRFRSCATNAVALDALLECDGASAELSAEVHLAYENTFGHGSFTGRSGSMHGYEGIGSVYWHMVSKLLLAVQERYWDARDAGAEPDVVARLAETYCRIRSGLGFAKSAEEFGAFPIDCYSHSPAHSGAQQPGMTGQVKEQVLTRFGELGLRVVEGRLRVEPGVLPASELFGSAGDSIVRFTFCSVPMQLERGRTPSVLWVWADGQIGRVDGTTAPEDVSAAIFERTGRLAEIRWTVVA